MFGTNKKKHFLLVPPTFATKTICFVSLGELASRKVVWSILSDFGQKKESYGRFFEKNAWMFKLDLLEWHGWPENIRLTKN